MFSMSMSTKKNFTFIYDIVLYIKKKKNRKFKFNLPEVILERDG